MRIALYRARHRPEHRHHFAALRLPRHRRAYHRAGRLPGHRPRLPPRRHGLSRPVKLVAPRVLCRPSRHWRQARAARAGAADHRGRALLSRPRLSATTRCCCSAAKAPACRRRCIGRPMPACGSRCAAGCARSTSPWPRPWSRARRCGRQAVSAGDNLAAMNRRLRLAKLAADGPADIRRDRGPCGAQPAHRTDGPAARRRRRESGADRR